MSSINTQKIKNINQTLKNLNNYVSIIENNNKKISIYYNNNKNMVNLNLSSLEKKRKILLNLDKIYNLKLDTQKQIELINTLVKNYQTMYKVVIKGGSQKELIEEEELLRREKIIKKNINYEKFISKSQLDYHNKKSGKK